MPDSAEAVQTSRDGRLKLAEKVAAQLETDIINLGCPVGLTLGNEATLAERFDVSRWVLREAIAITERDGLTEMRRGRSGGLVVATTADNVLAAALCNYLLFTHVVVSDLLEVRKIVDRAVYVLAARQMDDRHIPEALALLGRSPGVSPTADAIVIYDQTLKLSNNAFVGAFGASLSKLTRCLLFMHGIGDTSFDAARPISRRLLEIRRRQLECVVAADPYGVVEATAAASDAWGELFYETMQRNLGPFGGSAEPDESIAAQIAEVLTPGKRPKLPNVLATRIGMHILRNKSKPGEFLASETDLMARFGVGRHVLREAIRILERDGIVHMDVGRNGGLKAGRPDAATVIARAVSYLRAMGVRTSELQELVRDMLIRAAELAAARVRDRRSEPNLIEIHGQLKVLEDVPVEKLNRWLVRTGLLLAQVTSNAILCLFFDLVLGFGAGRSGAQPVDRDAVAESAEKLIAGLQDGDVLLARRAMAQLATRISGPMFVG